MGARSIAAALGAAATFGMLGGVAVAGPPEGDWRVVAHERFDRQVDSDHAAWFADDDGPGSPYDVDVYDNDGAFFDTVGGPAFRQQLATFRTYRKSFSFGAGKWLTAELAARDRDLDGVPDSPPSVRRDDGALLLDEPSHDGGVIVRSTNPLPAEYRVEATLKTIEFGGQRGGSWTWPDGRVNGYAGEACETNFPWASSGDFARPECDWLNVRNDANGFYYLGIMDYARPAPHNNVFIHVHRKVAMDSYSRTSYRGTGLRVCNPATGRFEPYEASTGNGVNAIFMTHDRRYANQPGTEYVMPSECGTAFGKAIVSQVDLRPELMPGETYRFAIERRDGRYVMEMSGNFHHVGQATYRYSHTFTGEEDGHPIWHYNQTPEEYDGRHDASWTWTGPGGTLVDEHTWPAGSAYPDTFLIGDPHMNFYEGNARIDDLRLLVPAR